MQEKLKLSATIITYNEEENIERCLKSLDFVDEIIVVDSGSSDKTVEIAKQFTDKVYYNKFEGYGNQKNFAATLAKNDIIFSIDADEEVSHNLKDYLIKNFDEIISKYDAIALPRRTFYLGKFIKNSGWYPDYKIRIYNKRLCKWDEKLVHETLICNSKAFYIPGNNDLNHYSYRDISDHINKMNKYTSLYAEENLNKFKNKKTKLIIHIIFKPLFKFIKMYFLKKGVLEGWRGFVIAFLGCFYEFLKYAKIMEKLND